MSFQQYPPSWPAPQPPPRRGFTWAWIGVAVFTAVVVTAVVIAAADKAERDEEEAAQPDSPATVTVTEPAENVDPPEPTPAVVPEPATPAGPDTSMGDGIHQVGVDVQPGRYKTPGPPADSSCYWSRRTDDSGSFESIITNGNIEGPGSLTVNNKEFVELAGDCEWTRTG